MKASNKAMTAILGTAFVTAMSVGSVSAAENPFASAELAQGYQLAAHGEGTVSYTHLTLPTKA